MPQYEGKTDSTAWWAYMQGSGFLDYMNEQGEELPLPSHNFELLQEALEQRYQQKLDAYRRDREANGFSDTPATLASFRLIWLRDILERNVEAWLNPANPTRQLLQKRRPSDRVELNRYKRYVLTEVETAEALVNDELSDQPAEGKKPKRVNSVAQDTHTRIYRKYDEYVSRGHTGASAIKLLVHDFRLEYSRDNSDNRKKQIQRIIRNRNNKEQ